MGKRLTAPFTWSGAVTGSGHSKNRLDELLARVGAAARLPASFPVPAFHPVAPRVHWTPGAEAVTPVSTPSLQFEARPR